MLGIAMMIRKQALQVTQGFVFGVILVVCVFSSLAASSSDKTASKKQPQPNNGLY
jgi:uncharacterized membrane protein